MLCASTGSATKLTNTGKAAIALRTFKAHLWPEKKIDYLLPTVEKQWARTTSNSLAPFEHPTGWTAPNAVAQRSLSAATFRFDTTQKSHPFYDFWVMG